MENEEKKVTTVEVQGITFSIEGMKKFKKEDFIKTWKKMSEAEGARGKIKNFDAEKAWETLKGTNKAK